MTLSILRIPPSSHSISSIHIANDARLLARGHTFNLLTQGPPVLRLKLGVLHALLAPLLMQSTNVILALLEVQKLVTNALLDEDTPRMLLDDALLVLSTVSTDVCPAKGEQIYSDDRIFHLLCLARLNRLLGFIPDTLQLLFVV